MAVANSLTLDRRNKLAQLLLSEGSVKVGDLAELFGVSTETIRKDLIFLENEGLAKKGHGGAVASGELLERPLSARTTENVEAKAKIAKAALELIPNNAVIILDAGSTTYSIAKLLTLRSGITIITNSVTIPPVLSGTNNTVYSLGGEMRGTSMALVGMWTISAINSMRADIAFIGTDGFFNRNGPCTAAYAEAEVKRAIIKNSKQVAIVSDSRKFKTDAMVQFCDWQQVDCLITDDAAAQYDMDELRKIIKIIVAK